MPISFSDRELRILSILDEFAFDPPHHNLVPCGSNEYRMRFETVYSLPFVPTMAIMAMLDDDGKTLAVISRLKRLGLVNQRVVNFFGNFVAPDAASGYFRFRDGTKLEFERLERSDGRADNRLFVKFRYEGNESPGHVMHQVSSLELTDLGIKTLAKHPNFRRRNTQPGEPGEFGTAPGLKGRGARLSGEGADLSAIPPLDIGSGAWVSNKLAADKEGVYTATLKDYRGQGTCAPDKLSGKDRDGRIWRKRNVNSHAWYLLSSLKKSARTTG
ncbi:MAG: hypothetical protein HZB38_06175 [Planctomycetes bacterium]|nr:hypothetical protein [Planctomycetota bacterium]